MAFEDGMDTIKSSSLLIISLWPVLILLGLVTAGIRMFRRRKLKLKGGL
jgi:hypothetical protein